MSLATWKAEFYPVEAKDVSEADALEHSVRKWDGLTAENLARHGVIIYDSDVIEPDVDGALRVTASTCALCARFYDEARRGRREACDGCPLSQARADSRGPLPCIWAGSDEGESPYDTFLRHDCPEPMIDALREAEEWQEAQKTKP